MVVGRALIVWRGHSCPRFFILRKSHGTPPDRLAYTFCGSPYDSRVVPALRGQECPRYTKTRRTGVSALHF